MIENRANRKGLERVMNVKMKKSMRWSVLLLFVVFCVGLLSACMKAAPEPEMESSVAQEPYSHQVRYDGETLGVIARWYTGKMNNWSAILNANPGLDPRKIRKGDTILVPRALLVKDKPMPKSAISIPMRSKAGKTANKTAKSMDSEATDAQDGSEAEDQEFGRIEDGEEADAGAQLERALQEALADQEGVVDSVEPAEVVEEVVEEVEAEVEESAAAAAAVDDKDAEREQLLNELLSE